MMISIIYANRNRDLVRVGHSLRSLKNQSVQNFEVIFVDFGSKKEIVLDLHNVSKNFDFLKFYHLDVSQVLWNKSKALNYGIKQASFPYFFIADVDLIFHPDSTGLMARLAFPEKFFLFKLGYLDRMESKKFLKNNSFEDFNPSRFGGVNGMILASTKSAIMINGFDEFFHFYGAEDEDFFVRLENAGYDREINEARYFYHNWHESFAGSEDKLLTGNPRMKNIMRINQQHFKRNREKRIIKPLRQNGMGEIINPDFANKLKTPSKIFKIPNILARVEHFLREELPSFKNEVIRLEFFEDPFYPSLKHRVKKLLGKQTQPYISMKEVNDMVLKEILFNYRDSNYSFKIDKDLKGIVFCIEV